MPRLAIAILVAIIAVGLFLGGLFRARGKGERTAVSAEPRVTIEKEHVGRSPEMVHAWSPSSAEAGGSLHSNLPDNEAEFLRRLKRNHIAPEQVAQLLKIRRTLENQIAALEREHAVVRKAGNRVEIEVGSFPVEAGRAVDRYVADMKETLGAPVPDELLYGDSFDRSSLNGGLFEKRVVVVEKWNGPRFEGYEFSVETFIPTRRESQRTTTVRGTAGTIEELWSRDPALKAHFRPSR
jgi:hypothetical protein